ncbi:MAG TPA: endonuclease/exonuclease/phosphatase family protein [Thermoanaerobaculia bacterium]|jgi:hypothetical protein
MRRWLLLTVLIVFAAAGATAQTDYFIGSQNTRHLGWSDTTPTKQQALAKVFVSNDINILQEVMKDPNLPAVTPANYLARATELMGPTTYKERYAWIWKSAITSTAGYEQYPSGSFDRPPCAIAFNFGGQWLWIVDFHAPFDSMKTPAEVSQLGAVFTYFAGDEPTTIGGDFNLWATDPAFNNLIGAGASQIQPNDPTTINSSGQYVNAYDHFAWNPNDLNVTNATREYLADPKWWYDWVSDHAGIYIVVRR